MAFDNTTTIIGNITSAPELAFTSGGAARCTFSVAWNQKNPNGDERAHFFRVTAWRQLAENAAESFEKGDRVWVFGRLDYSEWESDGQKRNRVGINAEDAGLSVQWKPAKAADSTPKKSGPSVPQDEPF